MNKYPGIYFASSIGHIKNQYVLVEVINLNYTPKTLFAGTNIGKINRYVPDKENTTATYPPNIYQWVTEHANISSSLTPSEKNRLISFLCRFPDLYAKDDKDSGKKVLSSIV